MDARSELFNPSLLDTMGLKFGLKPKQTFSSNGTSAIIPRQWYPILSTSFPVGGDDKGAQ